MLERVHVYSKAYYLAVREVVVLGLKNPVVVCLVCYVFYEQYLEWDAWYQLLVAFKEWMDSLH